MASPNVTSFLNLLTLAMNSTPRLPPINNKKHKTYNGMVKVRELPDLGLEIVPVHNGRFDDPSGAWRLEGEESQSLQDIPTDKKRISVYEGT
jgi:hypothetical protein